MNAAENRSFNYRAAPINLHFTVHSTGTSNDLVRTIKSKIIPVIMQEMKGGNTGLRESIRFAFANTQRAY
jgi:hypothetical protein